MTTEAQRKASGHAAQTLARALLEDTRDSAVREIVGPEQLKRVDRWIKKQNDPAIDRIEAIRRLLEIGLSSKALT